MLPDAAQWYANDLAIAALIVSVVSLSASGFSAWYSHKQAEATQRSAIAADKAAAAATPSLKMKRAFLTVSEVTMVRRDLDTLPRFVQTVINNGGETPATDVEDVADVDACSLVSRQARVSIATEISKPSSYREEWQCVDSHIHRLPRTRQGTTSPGRAQFVFVRLRKIS